MDLSETAHRRHDPLRDAWVLVSPGRTDRPWAGSVEPTRIETASAYDPDCQLCPGNARASGDVNPDYAATFVFTNDFAALRPGGERNDVGDGLFRASLVSGTCRVVCFSPRHDVPLGQLGASGIRDVIDIWAIESAELASAYPWVQVFENRGASMGASNPHPHGQIWATSELPVEAERELGTQRRYAAENGRSMLVDYANAERDGSRVVAANNAWLAVVPFWAAWPFETLVIPARPVERLAHLDDGERNGLAQLTERLLAGYDRLFDTPFPYSMGWHQAPAQCAPSDGWTLHAHYYPPLLRSANVRKFMVGYELLSEPQRDLSPEAAAERLRAAIES